MSEQTDIQRFSSAHPLREHPLLHIKEKHREMYLCVLYTMCLDCFNNKITRAALALYRDTFGFNDKCLYGNTDIGKSIRKIWRLKFNKKHCRACILGDLDHISWLNGCDEIPEKMVVALREKLGRMQNRQLDKELSSLNSTDDFHGRIRALNRKPEERWRKVVFAGTCKAGKSTIINAIIGKDDVCKAKTEVCTARIHYIYSKPCEDGLISREDEKLSFNFIQQRDSGNTTDGSFSTLRSAAYFNMSVNGTSRLCLIDTPGVDSNDDHPLHKKITAACLKKRDYDLAVYIMNATCRDTTADREALKNFLKAVGAATEKLFVINKADEYDIDKDNVDAIVRDDVVQVLKKLRVKNPVVCPISAKTALLLKLKEQNIPLSPRLEEKLNHYKSVLADASYDLSRFYNPVDKKDAEFTGSYDELLERCGFAGFERIILSNNKERREHK